LRGFTPYGDDLQLDGRSAPPSRVHLDTGAVLESEEHAIGRMFLRATELELRRDLRQFQVRVWH